MTLFLPLLTLLGCINNSAWPHYGGGVIPSDTGTVVIPTTPTLPCNSADQGTTAQLTVQNPNPEVYQLSQMDDACVEQFVTTVGANGAFNVNVGNHIFWVVREADGTYVRFFGIPSGTNVSWVEILP